MNFQDFKTKSKILIGICTPMILFVVLGIIMVKSIDSIVDTNKAVDDTHLILEETADLIHAAVEMETSMRGYLQVMLNTSNE